MDQIIPAPAPTRTEMGDLSSLTTTQKGSIVSAINEVDADVSALNSIMAKCTRFKDIGVIANSSKTIKGSSTACRGRISIFGNSNDRCAEFTFQCNSSSFVVNQVFKGSLLSYNVNTNNELVITSSSSVASTIFVEFLQGSESDITVT